jgi:O-antigen/teichoic acid export membrane protein
MVSTLGNFVIAVIAARTLSKVDFGAFGIAFTVFIFVVLTCRGTVGHMVLSGASANGCSARHSWPAALGAAMSAGLVGSLASAGAGIALGGTAGYAFIAIAIVLPGLCVQDIWRHCFIAAGRPSAALLNDLFWLLTIVPAVELVHHISPTSAATLILAWGMPGLAAALLGCIQGFTIPHPFKGFHWIKANRELAIPYFGEVLLVSGSQQIALFGLVPIAGLAAVGAIRGVIVFYGPLTVFASGLFLALVPDANRLRSHPQQLGRRIVVSSSIMSAAAILWTGMGYAVPHKVGEIILGETWGSARPLILAAGIGLGAATATIGPLSGLRALRASRYSFKARMWALPLMLLFSLSFAALWGAEGFVAGGSLESVISFLLVALAFRRANSTRGDVREHLIRKQVVQSGSLEIDE